MNKVFALKKVMSKNFEYGEWMFDVITKIVVIENSRIKKKLHVNYLPKNQQKFTKGNYWKFNAIWSDYRQI